MPMPGCMKLVSMALLMALATGASAQKTQLLVYTALETDQIKAYQEGFNRAQPDIRSSQGRWAARSSVVTFQVVAIIPLYYVPSI